MKIVHSQNINGSVKDYAGRAIPRGNVVLKTNKNLPAISEFFIGDGKGNLRYVVKKTYSSTIYLEASALNYEKALDSVVDPQPGKTYTFEFVLYPKATKLEEVVISERKKFSIKKDTVLFNVDKYKDGTERKVEDILKKLPGVEVAENGKIRYRGTEVSAVNLDGDDLFGSKYTIGTKNISIDMVDQIEAIENYSKNPLLKGIENSNKVALNLKLKKEKTDYSGTADLGYGYDNRSFSDMSSAILGVSSRFKSFALLSFNNTGNYDLLDRSSGSILSSDIDDNLLSKRIIDPTPINSVLGVKRSRVDEQWFGSYNFIYKFSKKARLKTNVVYLKDKVLQEERFQNDFFTSINSFSYADITRIVQRPEAKGIDLKFTYNTSKASLLELETGIADNNQVATTDFVRNLLTPSVTQLSSEDFLIKSKLQFTYKLNKRNALQYISLYSRNNAPQKFDTFGNFFSDQDIINTYFQFSEYRKEVFQNRIVLLGRRNNLKYAFTAGTDLNKDPFQSFLLENESRLFNFDNDFEYKKNEYFLLLSSVYETKKLKIEPSLSLTHITQKIRYEFDNSKNFGKEAIAAEPKLNLIYKLNLVSKLNLLSSYEQTTTDENFLISKQVIINNREISNNEISLDLQKRHNHTLGYRLNDLYHNIELYASIGYNNRKNVFLSNVEVNSNFTSTTYFQSPVNLDGWIFSGAIERYLRFIQTTLKLSSLYSLSNFRNVVNQSEIRDGESGFYEGTVFAKTAFRIPVNFENLFTYNTTTYSIAGGQFVNTNNAIKNSFKTIYKPSKSWLFTFTYDYFKPDTKGRSDFSFLDFETRFKPKRLKWISGRFIGKNLLDNRVFEQVQNSDFSTTIYQRNLIPRYFMLSLDLSF